MARQLILQTGHMVNQMITGLWAVKIVWKCIVRSIIHGMIFHAVIKSHFFAMYPRQIKIFVIIFMAILASFGEIHTQRLLPVLNTIFKDNHKMVWINFIISIHAKDF